MMISVTVIQGKRDMRSFIFLLFVAFLIVITACDTTSDNDAVTPEIPVKIDVKLKVGDILYENADAEITVTGLNNSDEIEWSKNYPYTGGEENVINIPGKYHHYKFSLQKWGHHDEQIFTLLELQEERADGPTPTTFVLGGEVQSKKLLAVTYYYESAPGAMDAQRKTEYTYDGTGKLNGVQEKFYNSETMAFELDQHRTFEYENNRVKKMSRYWSSDNSLMEETTYQYNGSGYLTAILFKSYQTGITSDVVLTYDLNTGIVIATYSNSNGTGFQYHFTYENKNIATDKVTEGAKICEEGIYTYDKNINPFKHLGYVEYVLTNFSINNRLTESVTYQCLLPSLVPVSFEYVYNDNGYPTQSTTNYQGGGKGKYTYEYQ
jgi:hypothetical protein